MDAWTFQLNTSGSNLSARIFSLLAFLLTTVPYSGHAQTTRTCFNDALLSICPFPVFIKPGQETQLNITCKYEGFEPEKACKIKIGVVFQNRTQYRLNGTAYLWPYIRPHPDFTPLWQADVFTPSSNKSISNVSSVLTLTLDPVTMSDLRLEWYCEVWYGQTVPDKCLPSRTDSYLNTTHIVVLPYPIKLTLHVSSLVEGTYNASETVALECRGLSSMENSSAMNLTFTLQTRSKGHWVDVPLSSKDQVIGEDVQGTGEHESFNYRSHTFKVNTDSIQGCRGRYRCLQSYKDMSFEKEASEEIELQVTPCDGSCVPSGFEAICEEIWKKTRSSSTTTTEQNNGSTDKNNTVTTNQRQSSSFIQTKMLFLSIVGAVATCALLVSAAVLLKRHRQKKNRGHRRPSGPRIIMMPGPAGVVAGHPLSRPSFSDVSWHQPSEFSSSYVSHSQPSRSRSYTPGMSYADHRSQFSDTSSAASSAYSSSVY